MSSNRKFKVGDRVRLTDEGERILRTKYKKGVVARYSEEHPWCVYVKKSHRTDPRPSAQDYWELDVESTTGE